MKNGDRENFKKKNNIKLEKRNCFSVGKVLEGKRKQIIKR